MFTGIIEATGQVKEVISTGTNKTFWITSPLSEEFKIDQSVSHDGVCLTVEEIKDGAHRVTAIEETLKKTNLAGWITGQKVNIERCMLMNGRLDGHIVQGHVDTTAVCIDRQDLDGSWEFRFSFPEKFAALVIEKGSISVNGTSLTIFNVTRNEFTVAIIPYTYNHTSISEVQQGTRVNIEFDIIGKYIQRRAGL
ncbi:riboflavin synthase alpha chain [Filimonas lacunae]|uniref:Riboflavin synthase n=1 Tax=Filimonas lacunae TaxID=477680 RepID=A0A173MAU6_9BACT|nr:riboflavin synthase [Filimonas lacunae]BAV04683.1 riboflavin synthase [Filimonas lacunae]SIT32392.1 riboflavin synthase alpha chain [Filimonas lacunae]